MKGSVSARPSWLSPWFSDPWRLRLLRLLVAVGLFALVWAVERYGAVENAAPEPAPADRVPPADGPPSLPAPTSTDSHDAEAEAATLNEAPTPEEAPSVAEAAPRVDPRRERIGAESAAPPAPRRSKPTPQAGPRAPPTGADPLVITGLALRDSSGRTIYRGEIDLAPTLERIAAGRRWRFPNDGSTFQNRENRLPRRPPGYYREWVVPTPQEPGPGPQRLITGAEGEVWYTSDHYRSFRRIPTENRIR